MQKICYVEGNGRNRLNICENSIECDLLKDRLEERLNELIEKEGFTHFIVCMTTYEDTYIAKSVLSVQKHYAHISLECVIPFEEIAKDWSEPERNEFFDVLEDCDKETMFSTKFREGCVEECIGAVKGRADYILCVGVC